MQLRQTQLAESSPQILVQYLMERTSQLRAEKNFTRSHQYNVSRYHWTTESYRVPLQLELADMRLESNDVDGAITEYEGLLDSDADQRLVRSGLARSQMLQENWTAARKTSRSLKPRPSQAPKYIC